MPFHLLSSQGPFSPRTPKDRDHVAIGIELEDHVQEAVAHPDIAMAVDAQGMRVHGDVGIEDAQHLVPVGSYSTIMMAGLRLNTSKLPLGRRVTAETLPNCSPPDPRIWVSEVIGQLAARRDLHRAGRLGLLRQKRLGHGGGRQQQRPAIIWRKYFMVRFPC
jgi:hypothetical protein